MLCKASERNPVSDIWGNRVFWVREKQGFFTKSYFCQNPLRETRFLRFEETGLREKPGFFTKSPMLSKASERNPVSDIWGNRVEGETRFLDKIPNLVQSL
jgi:hypothetical protein